METSDPDDAMTLAILATHPWAKLVGVTITPGGTDQVCVVREILHRLGKLGALIGVGNPKPGKKYVSEFHYGWLDDVTKDGTPDGTAEDVIHEVLTTHKDVCLLTGARLTNIFAYLAKYPAPAPCFSKWVGQGGFAGDSVVPEEHRLPKFAGRETCPTFNFNADITAAFSVLQTPRIPKKNLVSKNVCHGIAWDSAFHQRILGLEKLTLGMSLVADGMGKYLWKHGQGKLLHDPLAASVLLQDSVVKSRPIEIYREKGEWGSKLKEDSDTYISISVDKEEFFRVLSAVK